MKKKATGEGQKFSLSEVWFKSALYRDSDFTDLLIKLAAWTKDEYLLFRTWINIECKMEDPTQIQAVRRPGLNRLHDPYKDTL